MIAAEFSTPPDLRQFAALTAVAEAGSISGAGKSLGWSDATVNYHLGRLEATIGHPLLNRTKRGTTLTETAQTLLAGAHASLQLAHKTIVNARAHGTAQAQELRLGLFPSAAARLLPRITRRLRGSTIDLQAILAEPYVIERHLTQRRVDAALLYRTPRTQPELPTGLQITPVLTEELLLAVPTTHRLAREKCVTAAQLASTAAEPWLIGESSPDPVDDMVMDVFAEHGKTPAVRIQSDNYAVALGMVAAGLALTIVPSMARHNAPPGVQLRPIADTRFRREILLLSWPETTPLKQELQTTLAAAVVAAAAELTD